MSAWRDASGRDAGHAAARQLTATYAGLRDVAEGEPSALALAYPTPLPLGIAVCFAIRRLAQCAQLEVSNTHALVQLWVITGGCSERRAVAGLAWVDFAVAACVGLPFSLSFGALDVIGFSHHKEGVMTNDGVALDPAQIDQFIEEGFVRIDEAFSRDVAASCRRILWLASGCVEDQPSTWTKAVVRVGEIPHPIFREAANTEKLHAAFDALVGAGRWLARGSVGTFVIRFPSEADPGDCGWHVDMSYGTEGEPDFLKWRANISSRGRALLMLFLFSDVSEQGAPTLLRVGSHHDIARRLAPHEEQGLTLAELASSGFVESAHRKVVGATGPAGTVYLCHPFLVHSGQPLRSGGEPRFLGQPALLPSEPLNPWRDDASPVERAIRESIRGAFL